MVHFLSGQYNMSTFCQCFAHLRSTYYTVTLVFQTDSRQTATAYKYMCWQRKPGHWTRWVENVLDNSHSTVATCSSCGMCDLQCRIYLTGEGERTLKIGHSLLGEVTARVYTRETSFLNHSANGPVFLRHPV